MKEEPVKFFDEAIIDITYSVLWQIAKATIIDTGQARAKVIRKFADKYNRGYKDLEGDFFRYWEKHGYPENSERSWENYESTSIVDVSQQKERKILVSIQDDGFYEQANGNPFYPSRKPNKDGKKRDNSDFFNGHVDKIIDSMNNKEFDRFEKLDYDKLTDSIVENIENFLFKK